MRFEFEATGTIWRFVIFDKNTGLSIEEVKKRLFQKVSELDLIFSRFNIDSQLYKLNSNKELVNPDENLFMVIKLALKLKDMTNGVFTPFIGKDLVDLGYGSVDNEKKPGNKFSVEKHKITLEDSQIIDLGAIAKGFIIDECVAELKRVGFEYFVINSGGDIFVSSDHGKAVNISVENPESMKAEKVFALKNTSVCSSANNRRKWISKDSEVYHIQGGVTGVKGSTVFHPQAMVADTIATIIFLTGEMHTKELEKMFGEYKYFMYK